MSQHRHMVLVGVGLGMLLALVTGLAIRTAIHSARGVREVEARLPGMRDARSGARFKAGFWATVAAAYFAGVVWMLYIQ